MACSSVRDARTVILVEGLLKDGYVIRSERLGITFCVTLSKPGDWYVGFGGSFPQACDNAIANRDDRLLLALRQVEETT